MADESRRISSLSAVDRRMVESAPAETDEATAASSVEDESFDVAGQTWDGDDETTIEFFPSRSGASHRFVTRKSYLRSSTQARIDATRQAGGLPGMNAGLPQGRTPQDVQSPDSDAWAGALQPNLD